MIHDEHYLVDLVGVGIWAEAIDHEWLDHNSALVVQPPSIGGHHGPTVSL